MESQDKKPSKDENQQKINYKSSGDNSDNIKHQQVDLDRLNKNKDNDPTRRTKMKLKK